MPEKQGLMPGDIPEKTPVFRGARFEPQFAFRAAELHGAQAEIDPHWHNYLEFALLTQGALTVTLDGRRYQARRPALIIIRPGEIHSFSGCSPDAALRICLAGVEIFGESAADIRERLHRETMPDKVSFFEEGSGEAYTECSRILNVIFAENTEKRTGWQLMVRAKLLELEASYFRQISSDGGRGAGKRKTKQNERVERALAVIHSRFRDPEFSIGEAACAVGLSESRFIRFFREQCGLYFSDYLVNLRLSFAKEQLLGSNRKITVIAGDSGFNSLATFNRLFKKQTGLSPQAFRTAF
jgi:AraC-like DNA-binding protein/quercetin dioxygenase-like cupin family protein